MQQKILAKKGYKQGISLNLKNKCFKLTLHKRKNSLVKNKRVFLCVYYLSKYPSLQRSSAVNKAPPAAPRSVL